MIQLNLPRYWIDLYHPGHLFQAAGSLARQGRSQLLWSRETWLILASSYEFSFSA